MPENPDISVVDRPAVIQIPAAGSDRESHDQLQDAFKEFFGDADDKAADAKAERVAAKRDESRAEPKAERSKPSEPTAKAHQRPVEAPQREKAVSIPSKAETRQDAQPQTTAAKTEQPEDDDEDLAYVPSSNTRPTDRDAINRIKSKAQTWRDEAKRKDQEFQAYREQVRTQGASKEDQDQIDAEKRRADRAEQIAAQHAIEFDPEFRQRFSDPLKRTYDSIFDECIQAAAGTPLEADIREWAQARKSESPDLYGEEFWEHAMANPLWENKKLAHARFSAKVTQLTNLKAERDKLIQEYSSPEGVARRQQEQYQKYWNEWYIPTARKTAEELAPQLGEWAAPKDLSKAKDAAERKAFEAHNDQYQKFEDAFKAQLQLCNDESENKPRSHVQVALTATKAIKLESDLAEANARIQELETRLARGNSSWKPTPAKAAAGSSTKTAGGSKKTDLLTQSSHDAMNSYWGPK